MLNINGLGKSGYTASVPGRDNKSVGKAEKKDEKKKNTDRADFSSLMGKNNAVGGAGGLKVGALSEKTSGLSKKAQAYLEKLKKKYGNMDFIIQDYSGDEEADKLLAQGKGEYNVLITPDLLEKMAEDEDTAAEYEAMIDQSVEAIDGVKNGLGQDADMVSRYGVTFDKDGNMSIRALLAGDLVGSDGSSTVKANTVDDMLRQLNEAKESQAEKLAKLREERAKEAEEAAAEEDDEDSDITVIKHDNSEAAKRMDSVLSKHKEAEMQALLEGLDEEVAEKDNGGYRRSHAHFSAKA